MDEYTFSDLIVNPEALGLRDLIGKEVYYGDVPLHCIRYANNDYKAGILRDIRKGESAPFKVMTPNGFILCYSCIILKKEKPKFQYVPFESMKEFVKRYTEVKEGVRFNSFEDSFEDNLLQCGMWLQDKKTEARWMVTEIWNDGVVLGSNQSKIAWDELLKDYIFLDGTLCGKLVEIEHE